MKNCSVILLALFSALLAVQATGRADGRDADGRRLPGRAERGEVLVSRSHGLSPAADLPDPADLEENEDGPEGRKVSLLAGTDSLFRAGHAPASDARGRPPGLSGIPADRTPLFQAILL